jgi:hypothetical protein
MAIDPIIKDHQLWIGFVQPEGLVVSPHALMNAQAVLNRNVGAQQEILRRHTVPGFDRQLHLKNFAAFTREFWDWRESDLATPPDDLSARLSEYNETLRPTWVVRGGPAHGNSAQPENLILIEELPSGTDFDKAGQQSPAPETDAHRWHASPQSRFERILRETGVPIGLLVSPQQIRLVYAPKGESSGHVTFPIHEMTMAANWPMLAALHLLLHSDRLFIGPETQRLPAILEASRRYQNEVSIRLAGQVLRALNELVRGFQEADRAAHGRILGEALRHDPSHIYGGMLTTLMRMVFVLYAEDRSLMGSDETWLQNYSISGLYERLRADEGQYPDTMDSRYGAWAQIITLTRLLYDGGGHGSWRLPPRHGGLFNPDAFPFLEGRPWESLRSAVTLIEPPLVSDGVIFRILQDLLYLDGERISYRALDVEQIGSVYEAMMGFTVETAHGLSIGLGSHHLVINLEELLAKKPADRPKWLKENAACEVTGKATEQLKSAASVDELLAALRRRISKLYLDQNSNPITVPAGGIYLQPTEERRRSGSHYTPRSLTQPIVKTTLDPVVAQLGDNPTPEQILGLKVCDPAMGSGAFLVEACRYLGEKLEKAWIAHGQMPPIPADQDPLLHARRMVAQRCLYGVDKNPFAVNLAKLSLWLATFAKDHPFTFVDHTLCCGDSLVGLTAHQIEAFNWQPKEEGALLRDLPSRLRHILNARAQILDAADETPYEMLAQKLAVTEGQMADLRLAGDLTVAAFFSADKPKERETRRRDWAEKFRRAQERVTDLELDEELQRTVFALKAGPRGVRPFHWELEFPEVFGPGAMGAASLGFDAVVGNPPFLKGSGISGSYGGHYLAWILTSFPMSGGQADEVAYFFQMSFRSLRAGGCLGLLATQTISQGATRRTSLEWIISNGGQIYAAVNRIKWSGTALVTVSRVHICRRPATLLSCILNGKLVKRISSFLFDSSVDTAPATLNANANLAFMGYYPYGAGFTFDDDEADASPLREMEHILEERPSSCEAIFPYIGGEEFLEDPRQLHRRYAIYFGNLSESEVRRRYPELMAIVECKVRPFRQKAKNKGLREEWWLYYRQGPALQPATHSLSRMLMHPYVSSHLAFGFIPRGTMIACPHYAFAIDAYLGFAILQSRTHEVWVRFFASSLRDFLTYNGVICAETFPFPIRYGPNEELEASGRQYYEHRATLMVQNHEGLTETYHRFHNPDDHAMGIVRLRELHAEMDRAVLKSYGWQDINPACEFYPEFDDEDSIEDDSRPGGKRYRYRWPDDVRDDVLARLLELNRTRAEEEAQLTAAAAATKPAVKRGKKSIKSATVADPNLFDVQESTE